MSIWFGWHVKLCLQRMLRPSRTVYIKFFFEQFVNRFIDIERWAARPGYLVPYVQPKTTRTLHEQFDFATADFERLFLAWLIRFASLPHVICHRVLLYQYRNGSYGCSFGAEGEVV